MATRTESRSRPATQALPQLAVGAVSRVLRWVVLIAVAVSIIVPIVYAFLGGFRSTGALRNNPAALPDPWVVSNYTEILGGDLFWNSLWNSLVIAVITVVVVVGVSALAAYVFARFAFPGRELLFTLFALGLLFPAAAAILPLYILLRSVGLLDNPLGRRAAPGGVRHPADDHHPAPVLREHPA